MTPSAFHMVKRHLRRHLPSATYDFLARRRRAWQMAAQISAWRTEQIATFLQYGEPQLEAPDLEWFYTALRGCKTYLEYGSGGSTLAALRMVPNVVSVENDRRFYRAVTSKARLLPSGQYFPIFVYTGPTSAWGFPKVRLPTALRTSLGRRYARAPWISIDRNKLSPEVIFLDGRFRVACALESLLQLPDGSNCRLFLHDFEKHHGAYFPIFEFAEQIQQHGEAVIFRRATNFDQARCRAVLARYYGDFR
jgi:hypothetical protein